MSRLSAIKRNRAIVAYIHDKYAGKMTDIREARGDIQKRFSLTNRNWYVLKSKLQSALSHDDAGDDVIFEPTIAATSSPPDADTLITIPGNVPQECKDVFNKMLLINAQQESRISQLGLENQSLRAEMARMSSKCRWLAKTLGDAVTSV